MIGHIPDYVKIIGWEDFAISGDPHPMQTIYAASGGTSGAICFRGYGKINIAYNDIRGYQIYIDRVLVATNTNTDTLSPTSNYQWLEVYDTGDAVEHDIIVCIPFGIIQGIAADFIQTSTTTRTDLGFPFFPPTMLCIGDSITCGVNVTDYHDIYSYKAAKTPGTAASGFALPLGASGIGSETMTVFPLGNFNNGAWNTWAGHSTNRQNQIIAQSPDILTVFLGTNDVNNFAAVGTGDPIAPPYNNTPIAPIDFQNAYAACLAAVVGNVAKHVLCIRPIPRGIGPPTSTDLGDTGDAIQAAIASGDGTTWPTGKVVYIDTSGMSDYEIHPTATGHGQLAALMQPYLDVEAPFIVSATRTSATRIVVQWSDATFPIKTIDNDTSGTWPGGPGNMDIADYAFRTGLFPSAEAVVGMVFDGVAGTVTLTTNGAEASDTLTWAPGGSGRMVDSSPYGNTASGYELRIVSGGGGGGGQGLYGSTFPAAGGSISQATFPAAG